MNNLTKDFLKPVSKTIKIIASTSKVWKVISRAGNVELCHPFCESNPVEKWPGVESVDYVNYYNGLKYQRIFTDWIEGLGYDLLIGRKNGRKSKVVWRINKSDDACSELKITIYPHKFSQYPKFLKPIIYSFYVQPMLSKYLSSVLKGFQWYITQTKPVKKNQFGPHKWFSN
ncbi:MAG: hypothetical protein IID16_13640 [Candidatus Marinimicrobia bacterium]|nr:hypothetical protein [Candidatus Neomarinimicrobiota bacterium]